jgi:hypothetical protein
MVHTYLHRVGDTCAELVHNILSLDMRSGRVRMNIRWMWYGRAYRCTARGMMGSGFPDQVNDWPKDAADAPRGWVSVSCCIPVWSCNRFILALVLTLVVFAHPVPDFRAPVCVKRARYS